MIKPSSIEFRCSIESLVRSTFSTEIKGQIRPVLCNMLANNECGWAENFTFAIPVFLDTEDKPVTDIASINELLWTHIATQPNQYDEPIGYMLYEFIVSYKVDETDGDKEVGKLCYELYPIDVKNIIDVVRGNATHFKQITPDHVAVWFTKFDSEDEDNGHFKTEKLDKSDFEILRNTNGLGEAFQDDAKYIEKHINIIDTFIRDASCYYETICDF